MQKVKVRRYISGKRPEYAPMSSSDDDSDDDDFIEARRHALATAAKEGEASPERDYESEPENLPDDPRLRRLLNRMPESDDEEDNTVARIHRHRYLFNFTC